jgi:hypothetical protein
MQRRPAVVRKVFLHKDIKLTDYEFCLCGRVVDEFEQFCHWCKRPKAASESKHEESEDDKQMRLFDD